MGHGIKMQDMGAGEILLNSVDRDGTRRGYDIELVRQFTDRLTIPVIASGGAGKIEDFIDVVKKARASAAAAGSMFVFYGEYRAVLITYFNRQELNKLSC